MKNKTKKEKLLDEITFDKLIERMLGLCSINKKIDTYTVSLAIIAVRKIIRESK